MRLSVGIWQEFRTAGHLVFLRPCPAVFPSDVYGLHRLGKFVHYETKIFLDSLGISELRPNTLNRFERDF